jgi:iron(III) transport system ATP-binding protein
MDKGRVLQFATPSQLYREPADTTVAKFIGEGMIVPVIVVAVHADATCDVDLFGYRLRMRCPAAQRATTAFACLRASALSIVAPGGRGLRARVTGTAYQGGHFRLDACVDADDGIPLSFCVPEPCAIAPGSAVALAIGDGWVIPVAAG